MIKQGIWVNTPLLKILQLMSKSHLNKILITTLIIIWSAVGYKTFYQKRTKFDSETKPEVLETVKPIKIDKNKFEFRLPNRDPFLDESIKTKNKKQPTNTIVQRSSLKKTAWPSISFYGFVKKEEGNKPLAIVKINDVVKKIRVGELIGKIKTEKIYNDSIILSINNERKTILVQN